MFGFLILGVLTPVPLQLMVGFATANQWYGSRGFSWIVALAPFLYIGPLEWLSRKASIGYRAGLLIGCLILFTWNLGCAGVLS